MQDDIFKLFSKSIEDVRVKKQARGTFEQSTADYIVTLKAIVKRRNTAVEEIQDSEDKNTQTTVHFKPSDASHIALGNYVEIDGKWRSIVGVKNGKDFGTGKLRFLYVTVGNDITNEPTEPNWSTVVSA